MTDPKPVDDGGEGRVVEVKARTVDEAVARGLVRLGGLSRSEVKIDVLSEGKSGLLGFGAEEASVRLTALRPGDMAKAPLASVTAAPPPRETKAPPNAPGSDESRKRKRAKPEEPAPKPAPARKQGDRQRRPQPEGRREPSARDRFDAEPREALTPDDVEAAVGAAISFLTPVLEQLGYESATIERGGPLVPEGLDDDRSVVLTILGGNAQKLLEDDARPLLALQFLARMVVSRGTERWVNLLLDVDGDRARRIKELFHLAEQSADLVERDGRPVSLPPMSAYERRVVHLALREHETVVTQSIGLGDRRKVTVRLKDQVLPNV